jgi:signal transduction histidine kinase
VYRPPAWWNQSDGIYCCDLVSRRRIPEDLEASNRIAAALEAESFLSTPLVYGHQNLGRLYLTAKRRQFDNSDMYFILQVLAQVMPIVHNIRLVDRLTLDAAAEDRKRIARDLHDGVIQPYVGVRMGLDALRSKAMDGSLQVEDIDRLVAISQNAVSDLRAFLFQLRNQADLSADLPGSVRRFAHKFEESTGIAVEVAVDGTFTLSERLSFEAFMMVTEGLSNIRRHTEATTARITLDCPDGHLRLVIENPGNGSPPEPFTPRTITERAEALGGSATVECRPDAGTAVVVEVPL